VATKVPQKLDLPTIPVIVEIIQSGIGVNSSQANFGHLKK